MEKKEVVEKKTNVNKKTKRNRRIAVLIFLLIFLLVAGIRIRGNYLEYLELGERYISVFKTNMFYNYTIMLMNFAILFSTLYLTNRGIKKGLTPFFENEKKEMPKLPNKSISLVISSILSFLITNWLTPKIMLYMHGTSFGITDPIFGLDISYYMFQKPLIQMIVLYILGIVVGISIYMAVYYVIVFNRYFDGVERKMLKESLFMKKIIRNSKIIIFGIAILTLLNIQNIMQGKILNVNDQIDLVGAGKLETTIKLWGYIIFAWIIVVFSYRAIGKFKKNDLGKGLKNLAIIPIYLVGLFLAMFIFDMTFVQSNELDKEKPFIEENIANTRNAYNLNIEEQTIQSSGTIKGEEVEKNKDIISNIPIMNEKMIEKSLEDSQTITGHFVYPSINLAKYSIDNKERLVYLSPREITNRGRTYNNKTYEYTHGMGEVISSATNATVTGNVEYIQNNIIGNDEKIKISEPRIYFGLETRDSSVTNVNNKEEYDYTDDKGVDYTSNYQGKAGLNLGFIDRMILGITKGDLNLAFAGNINKDSKILINRQVVARVKKALPYLIYDENPYTVVDKDGRIKWVIDAYTTSSNYPYAQYTTIEQKGIKQKINYIRNSVKVIIDAYDGNMSFYLTDRNDPIAMAYRNIYSDLFMDKDEVIPEDIAKHLTYPKYLYSIQQEILKVYHNVKPDVLYRADDIWDIAKYNASKSSKSSGIYMKPYYTMIKNNAENKLGLIQMYTLDEKKSIIAYLVGTNNNGNNELKLYKFPADNNVLGPMQLDKQIEEDEAISKEIENLNVTGTRISKHMIIVPIENTLLYVEPIYQTMLNESEVPVLKKVVVASGNKLAIGDNLTKALEKLLSTYAIDIEIENTDDVDGLIDAIVRANKNLENSNKHNDWEMMGKDIKKLQDLIYKLEETNKLEKLKEEEMDKKINNEINVENDKNNLEESKDKKVEEVDIKK